MTIETPRSTPKSTLLFSDPDLLGEPQDVLLCKEGDDSFSALQTNPLTAMLVPGGLGMISWLFGKKGESPSAESILSRQVGPDWVDQLASVKGDADQVSYDRQYIKDYFIRDFSGWIQARGASLRRPADAAVAFHNYSLERIRPLRIKSMERKVSRLNGDLSELGRMREFQKGESRELLDKAIAWGKAEIYHLEYGLHPNWAQDGGVADAHRKSQEAFSQPEFESVLAQTREQSSRPLFQDYYERFHQYQLKEDTLKPALASLQELRRSTAGQGLSTRDIDFKIKSLKAEMAKLSADREALIRVAQFRLPLFAMSEFQDAGDFLNKLQIRESQVKPYELGKTVLAKLVLLGQENPYPGLLQDLQLLENYVIVPGHDEAVRFLIESRIEEAAARRAPADSAVLIRNFLDRGAAKNPEIPTNASYKAFLDEHRLSEESGVYSLIVRLRTSGDHPLLLKELMNLSSDSYSLPERTELAHRLAKAYFEAPADNRQPDWAEKTAAGFNQELQDRKASAGQREQRVEGIEKKAERDRERREERDRDLEKL